MRLNDSRGKREKGERDSEFVRSRLTILWSISRHSSTGYTLEPRESSRIKVKRTEWTHGENTGVDIELAVYLPSRMEYCGETFQTECRSLSLSLSFSHTHTHTHTHTSSLRGSSNIIRLSIFTILHSRRTSVCFRKKGSRTLMEYSPKRSRRVFSPRCEFSTRKKKKQKNRRILDTRRDILEGAARRE